MYHSVDDSGSVLSVSRDQLRWHLQTLQELGFRGLTLSEFRDRAITDQLECAAPEVLLTFDDGYQNFAEHAVPILGEFGFPATVFVVPAFMGKSPEWYGRDRHIVAELSGRLSSNAVEVSEILNRINSLSQLPLMTWAEAKRVSQLGFDVANHSLEHRRLTELTERELTHDLSTSRSMLAAQVGADGDVLCYPYGACDSKVIKATAAAGYRAGMVASLESTNNIFQLNRVGVGAQTTPQEFRYMLSQALDFEWRIRRVCKDCRGWVR